MSEEEPRRRTWVGGWLVSESFWRDVTSRSLAGVIVTTIAFLAAVGGGFIDWHTAWPILIRIAAFFIFVVVGVGVALFMSYKGWRPKGSLVVTGLFLGAAAGAAALIIINKFLP